jgi:hypothetical protein
MKYTNETKELVKAKVRKDFAGHGGDYFTHFEVTESMLDQFPSKKGTWAVLFNFEILFAVIYYKGVNPKLITFFEDCPDKKKIAESWGCKTVSSSVLLNKDNIKNYMKQFDNSISNVPYNTREDSHKGSVAVAGGKMGTVGDKTIGRKLNKIQRAITKDGGHIAQMGLKTSMLDEALIDELWNPTVLSLMVDRKWWDYNTFWLFGKKEANQGQYQMYGSDRDSQICAKIFSKDTFKYVNQQDSLSQLLSKGMITYTSNGNSRTIVRSYKKADPTLQYGYPTAKGLVKVIHGPKYAQYMNESAVSRVATDEPMLCDCMLVFPTKTIAEAQKMKLFTDVNPLLTYFWKKMNIKGRDQFWRYAKKFNLNQIKTGFEFPAEYNLTLAEQKYINDNFK